jgi:hypothetical protein
LFAATSANLVRTVVFVSKGVQMRQDYFGQDVLVDMGACALKAAEAA